MSLISIFTDAFKKASTKKQDTALEEAKSEGVLGPTDGGGSFTPLRPAPPPTGPGLGGTAMEPTTMEGDVGVEGTESSPVAQEAPWIVTGTGGVKLEGEYKVADVNIASSDPQEGGEFTGGSRFEGDYKVAELSPGISSGEPQAGGHDLFNVKIEEVMAPPVPAGPGGIPTPYPNAAEHGFLVQPVERGPLGPADAGGKGAFGDQQGERAGWAGQNPHSDGDRHEFLTVPAADDSAGQEGERQSFVDLRTGSGPVDPRIGDREELLKGSTPDVDDSGDHGGELHPLVDLRTGGGAVDRGIGERGGWMEHHGGADQHELLRGSAPAADGLADHDDHFQSSTLLDLRADDDAHEMMPGLGGDVSDGLDVDFDDVDVDHDADADNDESEL
jgi:hypothetical protein